MPTYRKYKYETRSMWKHPIVKASQGKLPPSFWRYVRDRFSYKTRPDIELKGYQKVSVPVGCEETVEITLGKDAFGYYPEKDFVIEPGDFDILVGPHSEELQSVTFTVTKN